MAEGEKDDRDTQYINIYYINIRGVPFLLFLPRKEGKRKLHFLSPFFLEEEVNLLGSGYRASGAPVHAGSLVHRAKELVAR